MISYNEFIEKISFAVEDNSLLEIEPHILFRSLENWDSLSEMSIIAMIDQEFNITIKSAEMSNLNTFQQLYDYIDSKTKNE